VTSAAEVPSLMLPCRAYKIRFGIHGSLPQLVHPTNIPVEFGLAVSKTDTCRIDALHHW